MGLRSVIPEVKFDLKKDKYPEIQEQIRNRSWKILANPETKVGRNMVQEFYFNLWQTDDVRKTIRHKTPGKCTGSHQVIITHGSEVDPTGIEGLSNFSLVVDLVKRIKIWLRDL
ncbi:hypothetical protein AHAS_Ahas18G0168900 [Arachis hypogaea]